MMAVMNRTWPTPTKSELFSSRKERNTVKSSYEKIDSTICDDLADPMEKVDYEVHPGIGEQDASYTCFFIFIVAVAISLP